MNPGINSLVVAEDLGFLEPMGDLLLGRFGTIRTMDDVAANIDGEVTTDGPGERVVGVGGTNKSTASLDHITA